MSTHEQPSPQVRLTILLVVVACLFGALFARLWFLQVIDAPKAQAAAAEAQAKTAAKLAETAERTAKEMAEQRLQHIQRFNDLLLSMFRDLDPRLESKGGPPLSAQLFLLGGDLSQMQAIAQVAEADIGRHSGLATAPVPGPLLGQVAMGVEGQGMGFIEPREGGGGRGGPRRRRVTARRCPRPLRSGSRTSDRSRRGTSGAPPASSCGWGRSRGSPS